MGHPKDSVVMGGWVQADEGTAISYKIDAYDESVEFRFGGCPEFQFIVARAVLAECIDTFPRALAELDTAIKAIEDEEA